MESAFEPNLSKREAALANWLVTVCGLDAGLLQPLAGDASFRRYFRILHEGRSYVVMDAPPPEKVQPFTEIAQALQQMGLTVPAILQADPVQGFLLLSDLGDATYLKSLTSLNADSLYERALHALSVLQSCRLIKVPPFTADFMWQEWAWHKEWFLQKLLSLPTPDPALDACYGQLVEVAVAQPQVFMHRDYHAGNLMVLPQDGVGILDFQDAFIGPVTYDLVSLVRDCYVTWPPDKVHQWARSYYQKLQLSVSFDEFLYWFDFMGMQRHLKALMTFARKQMRDHQPQYLQHIPRTLDYLITISARYPALAVLHHYLQETVQPAFKQVQS